jgi:hypothetical protein
VTEQEYVEHRLQNQIEWYARKSRRNHGWFLSLRVIEIVLATSIPLLTSMVQERAELSLMLGSISVGVAVIAAILSLFRFQELWIEYRATAETLKREKFLFLTRSGPYEGPGRFTALVERIETLLAAEATKWAGSMRLPSAADRGEKSASA